MKDLLMISVFTLGVTLLYTGVAQVLPQLENHPPAVVALGSNIGPEELAPIGAGVFEANCVACHKMGQSGRAPDLSIIGVTAFDRAAGRAAETGESFTDVDYLLESLCKPGDFLVEGYGNIMPNQAKALSGGQLLAVVAFLQNLGGEATAKGTDVDPVLRFGCASAAGAAPAAAPAKAAAVGPPEKVYEKYGCSGCHSIDSDERKIGPSLADVGKRLTKGQLYEAMLDPDGTMAVGDPPFDKGVMKSTLDGNGFYTDMTPGDYQALVDWLAGKKG
jgi:cytochrome c2